MGMAAAAAAWPRGLQSRMSRICTPHLSATFPPPLADRQAWALPPSCNEPLSCLSLKRHCLPTGRGELRVDQAVVSVGSGGRSGPAETLCDQAAGCACMLPCLPTRAAVRVVVKTLTCAHRQGHGDLAGWRGPVALLPGHVPAQVRMRPGGNALIWCRQASGSASMLSPVGSAQETAPA